MEKNMKMEIQSYRKVLIHVRIVDVFMERKFATNRNVQVHHQMIVYPNEHQNNAVHCIRANS